MAFTAEARKKAIEVRRHNAEQRRLKKQVQEAGTATTEIAVSEIPKREEVHVHSIAVPETDNGWYGIPLKEALEKLSEMKREYDRASQIILQRQSQLPVVWTCWTQSHKELVTKTVLNQCKKQIQDGRWVSKDDGAKDDNGKISPAVCCSMLCSMAYLQRPRKVAALSRS